jgi:hypothetical protein
MTKIARKDDLMNVNTLRQFTKALIKEHNIQTKNDLYGEDEVIRFMRQKVPNFG